MYQANLILQGLTSLSSPHFKKHYPYLISRRGQAGRSLLIASSIILIAIIAGITWYLIGEKNPPRQEQAANPNARQIGKSATAKAASPAPESADPSLQPGDTDLWQAIQDLLKVERVHHSGDPKKEARDIARNDYNHIKQLLKLLRTQGLEGDALYDDAEEQLVQAYGPRILKVLEGYRLLEEELAKVDLDAMTPEERFEYIHEARQYAFGEEMADNIFYNQEAFARYQLFEKSILADTSLSPETQQDALDERRKALQVDLAARGSYVSFADERQKELERKLQARYGDSLETMTAEEHKSAIWEMYSEELPPDVMDKVGRILAVHAEKKAEKDAYRQERDMIMNDPDLTYEQKKEQLADLKERFNITP